MDMKRHMLSFILFLISMLMGKERGETATRIRDNY